MSSKNQWNGCVWITGASQGIGRSLALALAKEGLHIAATARTKASLTALAKDSESLSGTIHPFPGDITNADQMGLLVENIERTLGPIALAILNAGIYLPIDAKEIDLSKFDTSLKVNLSGTAACLRPTIKSMKSSGGGQIAIVSSVTGYGGLPTSLAYGATKAALINMSETLRIELAPENIKVQVITPGFVDTPAQDTLDFPKPFMVTSELAAQRILKGLKSNRFEITFPKRFTIFLRFLNSFVPRRAKLNLIRRATGWSDPSDSP